MGHEGCQIPSSSCELRGRKPGGGKVGDETDDADKAMMQRCIALARSARQRGELPYAAIISQQGQFVCQSPNMANADQDVTHHAELVAISIAQKELGTVSLAPDAEWPTRGRLQEAYACDGGPL